MKMRFRFIVILIVVAMSLLLVWPNISVRTLEIYFEPNLKSKVIQDSIEEVKNYLEQNYPARYKVKVIEKKVTRKKSPEEIKKIIEEGQKLF